MGFFDSRRHLVRYGIPAEQKYLLSPFLGTYDLVVINANMVSHAPSALAAFIGERTCNKPFMLDPLTHAFQHDITLLQAEDEDGTPKTDLSGNPVLRKSFDKLCEHYGEPVASRARRGEVVQPSDFEDPGAVAEFAGRVVRFQVEVLSSYAEDKGLLEYYRFLGVSHAVRPVGVVAPYFYLEPDSLEAWLPVNVALARATASALSDREIYAQLVVSREVLLSEASRRRLADQYRDLPVDAVLLWVDRFDEHDASVSDLQCYLDLVERLGSTLPVVSLYGSFFSTAIMRFRPDLNLVGVSHSLEYGEDRSVVPAGGGLPVSRFYYPKAFRRLRFAQALRLARPFLASVALFLDNVCSCEVCVELMATGPDPDRAFALYGKSHPVTFRRGSQAVTLHYPDADTRDRCVRHFMWSKGLEFGREDLTLDYVLEALREGEGRHKSLGLSELAHCERWRRLLEPRQ